MTHHIIRFVVWTCGAARARCFLDLTFPHILYIDDTRSISCIIEIRYTNELSRFKNNIFVGSRTILYELTPLIATDLDQVR